MRLTMNVFQVPLCGLARCLCRFSSKCLDFISFFVDFPLGWISVFALALLDSVWASQISIELPSPWTIMVPAVFYLFNIGIASIAFTFCVPMIRLKKFQSCLIGIEYLLLYIATGYFCGILSYLVCTLHFPLVDANLERADLMLGFDWRALFHKESELLRLNYLLKLAYSTIIYQAILFILWCTVTSHHARMREVFNVYLMALLTGVILSGLMPALGHIAQPDLAKDYVKVQPLLEKALADVIAMRSGEAVAGIKNLNGIIVFPSFHAMCAIIYMYAFRGRGVVCFFALIVNSLMLFSTLYWGGHYLVDVLAGVGLALVTIMIVRFLGGRCKLSIDKPKVVYLGRYVWMLANEKELARFVQRSASHGVRNPRCSGDTEGQSQM